jgi:hypothetical protein
MKRKLTFGIVLILLMLFASGTVFSQEFEIAGGVLLGYGSAVEGKETPGLLNIGLGLQMGALWDKFAVLGEASLSWVLPHDSFMIMWNAGIIGEYYFFTFDEGESKLGIGLGGGYGGFIDDTWYARLEIPMITTGGKLAINGEYYFFENKPSWRVGIMYYFRGEQVMEFFQNQDIFPTNN